MLDWRENSLKYVHLFPFHFWEAWWYTYHTSSAPEISCKVGGAAHIRNCNGRQKLGELLEAYGDWLAWSMASLRYAAVTRDPSQTKWKAGGNAWGCLLINRGIIACKYPSSLMNKRERGIGGEGNMRMEKTGLLYGPHCVSTVLGDPWVFLDGTHVLKCLCPQQSIVRVLSASDSAPQCCCYPILLCFCKLIIFLNCG